MSDKSDGMRTAEKGTKAISSLGSFLTFKDGEASMVEGKPATLDTSVWWDGTELQHILYEKPKVPNTLLRADTALSLETFWSSLVQEVVRHLVC